MEKQTTDINKLVLEGLVNTALRKGIKAKDSMSELMKPLKGGVIKLNRTVDTMRSIRG